MIRHSSRPVCNPDIGCQVGSAEDKQAQRTEKGGKVKSEGKEVYFLVWCLSFSRGLLSGAFFITMAAASLQSRPVGTRTAGQGPRVPS